MKSIQRILDSNLNLQRFLHFRTKNNRKKNPKSTNQFQLPPLEETSKQQTFRPQKKKKSLLKPILLIEWIEIPIADYHLHALSSSLARLYQLVSYIRRGQSATSSVRARGRPPSPSPPPPEIFRFLAIQDVQQGDRFYPCREHPVPKPAPAEKNAKAWLNPERKESSSSSSFFWVFLSLGSPPRSLARSDPLGPRGARVNDRSLGQPQAVASESHTRCIRHVPRAGEQRDPPDWFSP